MLKKIFNFLTNRLNIQLCEEIRMVAAIRGNLGPGITAGKRQLEKPSPEPYLKCPPRVQNDPPLDMPFRSSGNWNYDTIIDMVVNIDMITIPKPLIRKDPVMRKVSKKPKRV